MVERLAKVLEKLAEKGQLQNSLDVLERAASEAPSTSSKDRKEPSCSSPCKWKLS